MNKIINTMNSMMGLIRQRVPEVNDETINPFGGEIEDNQEPRQRGIYRDPLQAARERDRPYDQEGALEHLKLAFPNYNEGDEAEGWLRNCDEYFGIYQLPKNKEVAIAAMNLQGAPKPCYKAYKSEKEVIMLE